LIRLESWPELFIAGHHFPPATATSSPSLRTFNISPLPSQMGRLVDQSDSLLNTSDHVEPGKNGLWLSPREPEAESAVGRPLVLSPLLLRSPPRPIPDAQASSRSRALLSTESPVRTITSIMDTSSDARWADHPVRTPCCPVPLALLNEKADVLARTPRITSSPGRR
jgi:hypothetical protein